MSEPLLELAGLTVEFALDDRAVRAVQDVSFSLAKGRVLGLVGESGCGKSATCMSIMGLLPQPPARVVAGKVLFEGRDLLALGEEPMRQLRGRAIGMIFQDPMSSLNPYLNVEEQLVESPMLHLRETRAQARERALFLLDKVGIPEPRRRLRAYPHELSGGMRQRVMIAMALLCEPRLVIADEPTTALDVTTQAQILELLLKMRDELGVSIILVTHDLGVVAETCDEVAVMYAGRIVELAPAGELFAGPRHPYTAALLASVPRIEAREVTRLATIEGLPPRLDQGDFTACTFAPRCPGAVARCRQREPELVACGPGRSHRCLFPLGSSLLGEDA